MMVAGTELYDSSVGVTRCRVIFVVLSFALLSLISNPFLFEKKGHYFYTVLRAIDQELFVGNSVISGLGLFRSGYYEGLSIILSLTGAGPDLLEPVVHVSYVISKFVLMALVVNLALTLGANIWSVILFAAWAVHPKSAAVGAQTDVTLFMPVLTHLEVAVLLCLAALYACLHYRKWVVFWLLLSIALFIHPLVTLHFALVVGPAVVWFLRDRVMSPGMVCGMTIFLVSIIGYASTLAPPAMDAQAEELFLSQIFARKHASPLFYGAHNWTLAIGAALLALGMMRRKSRSDRDMFLSLSILMGLISGIALSIASLVADSVVLVQLQSLRIFLWVNLFSFLAIVVGIRKYFVSAPAFAAIVLGVVTLSILRSVWLIVFILLGIAYLAWMQLKRLAWWNMPRGNVLALACVPIIILFAMIFREWLPIGRLQHFGPALVIATITACLATSRTLAARRCLAVAAVLTALAFASMDRSITYGGDHGQSWDSVRKWCRENTDKSARFLTPSDVSNFSLRSLRSTVSMRAEALIWVDPHLYLANMKRATIVDRAYEGNGWNLEALEQLAREWHAEYVLIRGAHTAPVAARKVYESGPYSVFQLDAF
jgi:hypothetical protein